MSWIYSQFSRPNIGSGCSDILFGAPPESLDAGTWLSLPLGRIATPSCTVNEKGCTIREQGMQMGPNDSGLCKLTWSVLKIALKTSQIIAKLCVAGRGR